MVRKINLAFNLKDIYKANYIFATGTAAEIQKINKIENKKFSIKSDLIDLLINDYSTIKDVCPNSLIDLKKILRSNRFI